ncbi:zinc transporter ZntB [Thalassococcus sp. BH17M4-6]|uniref:zinc transporter ZntB n=1 Tax=Thalassococcus sp. BH17M4-6 TaxID=3413148 RepID=UPI003BC9A874
MTPICAFDIAADGTARPVTDLTRPCAAAYRWVHCDLADPDTADWLDATLPELAAETLQQVETRPRVLAHTGGLIVALRGLNLNAGQTREDMVSIRLWVTETLIVSSRRRRVFAAEELRAEVEAGKAPPAPGAFLASLCEKLMDKIEENGVALEDILDELEDVLFEDDTAQECRQVPELRRAAIRLGRFLNPQATALHALAEKRSPVLDEDAREDLGEIANRAQRAVEELTAVRERLAALSDHLDMAQNARLSRNSYALSVVAAVFLPMGFLTGLFGVNVAGMPGTDTPMAFALLTLATLAMGGLVWLLLRLLRLY